MARILVTRPQPGADRTAARLVGLGHAPIVSPLLRIRRLDHRIPPGPYDAVLMTSANAARFAEPTSDLLSTPCLVTGRATGVAAREAGFCDIHSAEGDVHAVAELVRTRLPGARARLLYLAGRERAGDLATVLRDWNYDVDVVEVYASDIARLDPRAHDALAKGCIDIALLYSPRTAVAFASALRARAFASPPMILCLSEAVAEALRAQWRTESGDGLGVVPRWPTEPSETALLALISDRRRAG